VEEAECLARLAAARAGRLATRRVDGAVDLVPFVFALDGAGRIVSAVDHKPKRHQRLQRLENIRAVPEVTVLVDHYDEDWSTLWWVRARGLAEVIDPGGDRDADHAAAVDALVAKYPQYHDRRPAGAAIVVTITELRGWKA
jgi:PPOX class probable F420-dependent enzyme